MLRSCYTSKVRFFTNSALEVDIRWFFCDDAAPSLPYETVFNSRNWDSVEDSKADIGEIRKVANWVDGSPPPYGPVGDLPFIWPPFPQSFFLTIIWANDASPIKLFAMGQVIEMKRLGPPLRWVSDPIVNPNFPALPPMRIHAYESEDGAQLIYTEAIRTSLEGSLSMEDFPYAGAISLGKKEYWENGAPFGADPLGTGANGICVRCGPGVPNTCPISLTELWWPELTPGGYIAVPFWPRPWPFENEVGGFWPNGFLPGGMFPLGFFP